MLCKGTKFKSICKVRNYSVKKYGVKHFLDFCYLCALEEHSSPRGFMPLVVKVLGTRTSLHLPLTFFWLNERAPKGKTELVQQFMEHEVLLRMELNKLKK